MADITPGEMAAIIAKEFDADKETAEAFMLRRFADQKLSTFEKAVAILEEIDAADQAAFKIDN